VSSRLRRRVLNHIVLGACSGDAFIGSFAHFYALSGDVADALHWAVRYAALSVTRRGTQKSYVDAAAFREFCAALEDGPPAR
jgi:ribokinase